MAPQNTQPQVRNLQPPVIRGTGPNGNPPVGPRGGGPTPSRNAPGVPSNFNQRGGQPSTSNPANPGVRGGPQRPAGPGTGPSTRGVIGSRQSQAAARAGAPGTGGQQQSPGVRAAKMKSGGDQLNRGVIRGAKQAAPAARPADNYGQRPARGGVLKSKDEDGVESTYEEQVFTVDQQVVPGVIRGYKNNSKASGGRGGNNKPAFDDDDDW